MKKTILYVLLCVCIPHAARAQFVERLCGGHMPCSYDQFKAGQIEWFQRADANHDGIIDAAEQAPVWKVYIADVLPACTLQDVGMLNLTHLPTEDQMRSFFAQADSNSDGVIDKSEDQRVQKRLNQTCALLHDPQMQKIKRMLQQLK